MSDDITARLRNGSDAATQELLNEAASEIEHLRSVINNDMDFFNWLKFGADQKWVHGKVFCETHEGAEMTEEEWTEFDEGSDPCIFCIRVWND